MHIGFSGQDTSKYVIMGVWTFFASRKYSVKVSLLSENYKLDQGY